MTNKITFRVIIALSILLLPNKSISPLDQRSFRELKVYVWNFKTPENKENGLTKSLTEEFEQSLINAKYCTVLERRNIDRLLSHIDNEKSLLGIKGITNTNLAILKSTEANAVAFGDVFDDLKSGQIGITIKIQSFGGEILEKQNIWFSRGKQNDPESRKKAIDELVRKLLNNGHGALKLVEVKFDEEAKEFPVLDIMLRNTGEIALIKRLEFEIERVWEYQWIYCPYPLKASWNYDILLPIDHFPSKVVKDISQVVKSGDADRFTLTLGNNAPIVDYSVSYVFLLSLKIIYDEDDKSIFIPDIAFISAVPIDLLTYTDCKSPIDVYVGNKRIEIDLQKFSGLMNNGLKQVLKKYEGSIVPKLVKGVLEVGDDKDKINYYITSLMRVSQVDPSAIEELELLASNSTNKYVRDIAEKALQNIKGGGQFVYPEDNRNKH